MDDVQNTLRMVEDALKDKCTHYLIVISDGASITPMYNSGLVAHSMAHQVMSDIEAAWADQRGGAV